MKEFAYNDVPGFIRDFITYMEAIKGKSQTNWTSSNTRVIEHYNNIESLVFQMPQESDV